MSLFKSILIIAGTLSLCLGALGVFIPGLPTTPFILLSAGLYVRSSDRLYRALVSNRHFGPYIRDFNLKQGMTMKVKLYAIGLMWLMISASCIFFISSILLKLILLITGLIGTSVMGLIIPTHKVSDKNNNN